MHPSVDSVRPPARSRVVELDAILRDRFKLFENLVVRGGETFGAAWLDELEETLERVFPHADGLVQAVEGYVAFVMDTMRRQREFDRTGAYPELTYEQAAQAVYLDEHYMTTQYLPGLLLSHYLWPHHHHLLRFFDAAFAAQVAVSDAERFVEVAVGTGIYSRRLLQRIPDLAGVGFDVSPAVKRFAEAHLAGFGLNARYSIRLEDILEGAGEPCSWLICVELLEHMEDPLRLLAALRRLLRKGGRAFISTALNAPSPDHIYLYRDSTEVVCHLEEAGFGVEQSFAAPAFLPRRRGELVPVVAAFIVL